MPRYTCHRADIDHNAMMRTLSLQRTKYSHETPPDCHSPMDRGPRFDMPRRLRILHSQGESSIVPSFLHCVQFVSIGVFNVFREMGGGA